MKWHIITNITFFKMKNYELGRVYEMNGLHLN